MTDGGHVTSPEAWGLRAVREAIAEMDPRARRRARSSSSAVEAMGPGEPSERLALVLPRLVAYARALQFDGEWDLATDVYRTILAHAAPAQHADTVIIAEPPARGGAPHHGALGRGARRVRRGRRARGDDRATC